MLSGKKGLWTRDKGSIPTRTHRPPYYNRKLRPEIKHLHDHAYDDIHVLIQMLNKEMNLCL